jgi:hypothetical protein
MLDGPGLGKPINQLHVFLARGGNQRGGPLSNHQWWVPNKVLVATQQSADAADAHIFNQLPETKYCCI